LAKIETLVANRIVLTTKAPIVPFGVALLSFRIKLTQGTIRIKHLFALHLYVMLQVAGLDAA
jgi:hypothetical protein